VAEKWLKWKEQNIDYRFYLSHHICLDQHTNNKTYNKTGIHLRLQTWHIITILINFHILVRCHCMSQMYVCFSTFVVKVPDDSSGEPKHTACCCVVLKCCMWWYTLFVFQYGVFQYGLCFLLHIEASSF
jgi:hypothetical protein